MLGEKKSIASYSMMKEMIMLHVILLFWPYIYSNLIISQKAVNMEIYTTAASLLTHQSVHQRKLGETAAKRVLQ